VRPFGGGGIGNAIVIAEADRQVIARVEDWWTIVLESGFRSTVEQISTEDAKQFQEVCVDDVRRQSQNEYQ
jgi:hypothetical protein